MTLAAPATTTTITYAEYWQMVLGRAGAEQIVAEYELDDGNGLDEWLDEAEREAISQGAILGEHREQHVWAITELRAAIVSCAAWGVAVEVQS